MSLECKIKKNKVFSHSGVLCTLFSHSGVLYTLFSHSGVMFVIPPLFPSLVSLPFPFSLSLPFLTLFRFVNRIILGHHYLQGSILPPGVYIAARGLYYRHGLYYRQGTILPPFTPFYTPDSISPVLGIY